MPYNNIKPSYNTKQHQTTPDAPPQTTPTSNKPQTTIPSYKKYIQPFIVSRILRHSAKHGYPKHSKPLIRQNIGGGARKNTYGETYDVGEMREKDACGETSGEATCEI